MRMGFSFFACSSLLFPSLPFPSLLHSPERCWTKCKSKGRPARNRIKENYIHVMCLFYSSKSYIKGERDTIIYYSTCYQLGYSRDNGHDIEQPGHCTMFSYSIRRTRREERREGRRWNVSRREASALHRRNVIGSVVFATGAANLFVAEYASDLVPRSHVSYSVSFFLGFPLPRGYFDAHSAY